MDLDLFTRIPGKLTRSGSGSCSLVLAEAKLAVNLKPCEFAMATMTYHGPRGRARLRPVDAKVQEMGFQNF